jgi:hypothetical protein
MVNIVTGIVNANEFDDYVKVADKLAIAVDKQACALDRQHDVKRTNALEKFQRRSTSFGMPEVTILTTASHPYHPGEA